MVDSENRVLSLNVDSDGAHILVRIGDTGCGIQHGDWDRIFDHGYSTKGKGHGFGLYYARQELQRFRGSVAVESSEPGEGTVIVLRLRASESGLAKPAEMDSEMRVAA
jgi:sensor histidine kinase regulating citrate/malate metabolism